MELLIWAISIHGPPVRHFTGLNGCFMSHLLPQGLGEMMPEQLWRTTLDPAARTLRRLTIADAAEADALFNAAHGRQGGAAARAHPGARRAAVAGPAGHLTLQDIDNPVGFAAWGD